jgi:predicted RNA-binding protein
MLATAPVCDNTYRVGKLTELVTESQSVSLVYVTDYLDGEFLAEGCVLVVESEEEDIFAGDAALEERFSVRKATRYGRTWIHILDLLEA